MRLGPPWLLSCHAGQLFTVVLKGAKVNELHRRLIQGGKVLPHVVSAGNRGVVLTFVGHGPGVQTSRARNGTGMAAGTLVLESERTKARSIL